MEKKLPHICPACGAVLHVACMHCTDCDTNISGDFALPLLMSLPADEQAFVLDFVLCGGSLKELARRMDVSYPTVRNRLDEIINKLLKLQTDETVSR